MSASLNLLSHSHFKHECNDKIEINNKAVMESYIKIGLYACEINTDMLFS